MLSRRQQGLQIYTDLDTCLGVPSLTLLLETSDSDVKKKIRNVFRNEIIDFLYDNKILDSRVNKFYGVQIIRTSPYLMREEDFKKMVFEEEEKNGYSSWKNMTYEEKKEKVNERYASMVKNNDIEFLLKAQIEMDINDNELNIIIAKFKKTFEFILSLISLENEKVNTLRARINARLAFDDRN